MAAQSATCSIPPGLGLGRRLDPVEAVRAQVARQSAIHSTCCSIETTMLDRTEGLPGPVMVKRLGNPATVKPR